MASLPIYNPQPDIYWLVNKVVALEEEVQQLKQLINIPTIIDKGDGDLEVTYTINNGRKNNNNIQRGDSQESLSKEPHRSGKQKKSNNKQDTKPGQVQ